MLLAIIVAIANHGDTLVRNLASMALPALLVIAVAGLIGWAPRGPVPRRRASTLITLNRASSVALLVVGRAYTDDPEVLAAVVTLALLQTVLAVGLSMWWRRDVVSQRI